jgi:hypothetical protein
VVTWSHWTQTEESSAQCFLYLNGNHKLIAIFLEDPASQVINEKMEQ